MRILIRVRLERDYLLVTTQERHEFSGGTRNWRWRAKVASKADPATGLGVLSDTSRTLCRICIPVELKGRRHPSQASSHLEGGFPGRYIIHREDPMIVSIGRTHSCVGSSGPIYGPTHRWPRFAGFPGVFEVPCLGVSVHIIIRGSQPLNAGGSQPPGASLIDPSVQRSMNGRCMSTYQIPPAFRIKGSSLFINESPRTWLRRPAVIATQ